MESDMPKGSGKSKVDKLDEGFLFLISLSTIVFTMVQAFFGGFNLILYSIPLLIVGVIMPFYYGYWKGALEDSAIMRTRGWIYLYTGTIGYVVAVIYLNVWGSQNPVVRAGGMILLLLFRHLKVPEGHRGKGDNG
jgi:membrane-bound ClpP family serine protease